LIWIILFTICLHRGSLQGGLAWQPRTGSKSVPAGKVVAKETWSRNFAVPIDNKVGGISGVLEGYLGSGRVAGLVELGCVEGSDIIAEMLMRRQNSFA